MTKLAHIVGGVIADLPTPVAGFELADCFDASYLTACVEVDDIAEIGWVWDGKTASAPQAPDATVSKQFTFLGFLTLFTPAEQSAIVLSDNAQIKLFCLMAAGANYVDLTDPTTIAGTKQLESLGLIGKGRAADVLSGQSASAS